MKLGDRFAEASPALRALYAAGKRAQWVGDDIAWHAFSPAPRAGPGLARAFAAWSDALLGSSSRLASTLPNPDAQLLLAVHARDYARHVEVWRRYVHALASGGATRSEPLSSRERLWHGLTPEHMLGAQLPVVNALAEVYGRLSEVWTCPLGRSLCDRLTADTHRHVGALGAAVAELRAPIPSALEAAFERVGGEGGTYVMLGGLDAPLRAELGPVAVRDLAEAMARSFSAD